MKHALPIAAELRVSVGQATDAGAKPDNEDCMGLRVPEGPALTLKGITAVIADGVSSAEAGREASESCVQSFLADYYSTPDGWATRTSAQAVLTALNRWLYSKSHGVEAHRGYVSTLSALILKSRTAHLLHVGDTRIYRYRAGVLEQLTRDHSTRITETDTYLSRAMGMDVRLDVDYRSTDIEKNDIYLLTTDGVHDFVAPGQIKMRLSTIGAQGLDHEMICRQLISDALAADSKDNLTCQIIQVDHLPDRDEEAAHGRLTRLPFPPPLSAGIQLDGYLVEKELHASSRSQLYLVTDIESRERLVMKTPSVNFEDNPAYIERFVMEPWIGRRVAGPEVVRVIESDRPQNFLYYLMEYVDGITLRDWIDSHPQPEISEVLAIVDQLVSAVRALERKETLHQDLKPENILLTKEGDLKLVDFGSCRVAGILEIDVPIERDPVLGTACYSAPETFRGESAGIRSEIFSLGTIVYELLTGALPYGEEVANVQSAKAAEKLRYAPSHQKNAMVPHWMDAALRRSLSISPRLRYGLLSEFLFDLRHPNPRFLQERPLPLIERDPLRFWKTLAALLGTAWFITIWLLLG